MRHLGKLRGALAILLFITLFALAGLAVMYLWNLLIPAVIGWSAINYWQALGFMVLTRILFGGFGKFGPFGHHPMAFAHHRGAFGGNREEQALFHEQMKNMSWEERREHIRRHMAEFRDGKQGRHSMQEPASDNQQ